MKTTREKLLAGSPRAFVIFEGACPDCFDDLADHGKSEERDIFGNPKWYEFKCKGCGKVHFVEQTEGGDWATN